MSFGEWMSEKVGSLWNKQPEPQTTENLYVGQGKKRQDAQGHQLVNEGLHGAQDTAYFTDKERKSHQASFAGGQMNVGGKALDTRGGGSLNLGGDGRNIFTMSPDGKFTVADANKEMKALNGGEIDFGKKDFKNVHHSTLAQGKKVAAAGEMIAEDGQLTHLSDKSGHYMPKPELTRQAVAGLDKAGVETQKVQLELEEKGATPGVVGSALEILGYEKGATNIQERMVGERKKKGGMLDEIKRLGADKDVVEDGQILPSKVKGADAGGGTTSTIPQLKPQAKPKPTPTPTPTPTNTATATPTLAPTGSPGKSSKYKNVIPPKYENEHIIPKTTYKNANVSPPTVYKNENIIPPKYENEDIIPKTTYKNANVSPPTVYKNANVNANTADGGGKSPGALKMIRNKLFGGLF